MIFRMRNVPVIDATGLRVLNLVREKFHRRGTRMVFSGMQPQPMKVLFEGGFSTPLGWRTSAGISTPRWGARGRCSKIHQRAARRRSLRPAGFAGRKDCRGPIRQLVSRL